MSQSRTYPFDIPSGTVITPEVSGSASIGTPEKPFNAVYTDNGYGSQFPKAWVRFDGTDASIKSSYNISGVSHTSTGNWRIYFDTPLNNANYCVTTGGNVSFNGGGSFVLSNLTASYFDAQASVYPNVTLDVNICCFTIWSN